MWFLTPISSRRHWATASLISLVWSIVIGLLWVMPNGAPRRGWSYDHYGLFNAFVRIRDYRHTGDVVGYEAGDGLILSIFLTILFTVAAIVCDYWLIKYWRKPGTCTDCGYDLRGNVSGACSECGKVISPTDEKK